MIAAPYIRDTNRLSASKRLQILNMLVEGMSMRAVSRVADSKMILAYEVGDPSSATAIEFMDNLCGRLANRVQLTTDGHKAYLEAVERAFAR